MAGVLYRFVVKSHRCLLPINDIVCLNKNRKMMWPTVTWAQMQRTMGQRNAHVFVSSFGFAETSAKLIFGKSYFGRSDVLNSKTSIEWQRSLRVVLMVERVGSFRGRPELPSLSYWFGINLCRNARNINFAKDLTFLFLDFIHRALISVTWRLWYALRKSFPIENMEICPTRPISPTKVG